MLFPKMGGGSKLQSGKLHLHDDFLKPEMALHECKLIKTLVWNFSNFKSNEFTCTVFKKSDKYRRKSDQNKKKIKSQ